jgi:hypothetical protein
MRDRFSTYDASLFAAFSPSAESTHGLRPRAGAVPLLYRFFCLFSFLFILLFSSSSGWAATVAGTKINNSASATYISSITGTLASTTSNTASVTTTVLRTRATIEFLQYAPTVGSAQSVTVQPTSYSPSGSTGGPFNLLPAPVSMGSGTLSLGGTLPLVPATVYHQGEPIFIRLTDLDQNNDPTKTETVVVTITNDKTGDREVLLLTETGPNTGVFVGFIQSSSLTAVSSNGVLNVADNSHISVSYTDPLDNTDTATTTALIDPYGLVFSSATGLDRKSVV